MIEREILQKVVLEQAAQGYDPGMPRESLYLLKKYLAMDEILVISGVRRSGKTTLMVQLMRDLPPGADFLYINFEDERLINFNVSDFDSLYEVFLESASPHGRYYLFFDEIQEIEGWQHWVNRRYAEKRIKFIISGSNASLLSGELSSLLTGRQIVFKNFPFSFLEFLNFTDQKIPDSPSRAWADIKVRARMSHNLRQYLFHGGFPAYLKSREPELLKQYLRDFLYRDIVRRHSVRDVRALEHLAIYLLTNSGMEFSYTALSKTLNLDVKTIQEYIKFIVEANLIMEIGHFAYSYRQVIKRNKKVYSIDPGLRNMVSYRFSEDWGHLAENIVLLTLSKKVGGLVTYWKNKREIDFVFRSENLSLDLYNVCFSDHLPEREMEGLIEGSEKLKRVRSSTIISRNQYATRGRIKIIPLWIWLLENDPYL